MLLVDKGETFSKSAAANAAKEKIESSGDDNDTSGDHFGDAVETNVIGLHGLILDAG